MLEFLSCLVDRLAGLLLEAEGPLTADIDVEKPARSTGTSIEHRLHPIEADIKNCSHPRSYSCLLLVLILATGLVR